MLKVNRFVSSMLLAAALAAPAAVVATATPQDNRIYDRDHKDYHNWDDHEDRAYRQYLKEQHKEYHEYNKLNERDQRAYWKWRHDHPDHD
jgi:hypothetical protein